MSAPVLTDKQREAKRLKRIRDDLHAIDPGEWMQTADGDDSVLLEGRGPQGERFMLCRFGRDAGHDERRFIADAPSSMRFLLRLIDRAIADKRKQLGEPDASSEPAAPVETAKDYAAEAAMRCAEPPFKKYLEDKHGLQRPLTDERCTQKLRSVLAIQSRRELNEAGPAAERWKALKGDFENWQRTGR